MHWYKIVFFLCITVSAGSPCSSGYWFSLIPGPKDALPICNPYNGGTPLKLACQITATGMPINISWYFNNSLSDIKIHNTSEHTIEETFETRGFEIDAKSLLSVLTLHQLNNGDDTGRYICKGHIGSTHKLLPEPFFNLPSEDQIQAFPSNCPIEAIKAQTSLCAEKIPLINTALILNTVSNTATNSIQPSMSAITGLLSYKTLLASESIPFMSTTSVQSFKSVPTTSISKHTTRAHLTLSQTVSVFQSHSILPTGLSESAFPIRSSLSHSTSAHLTSSQSVSVFQSHSILSTGLSESAFSIRSSLSHSTSAHLTSSQSVSVFQSHSILPTVLSESTFSIGISPSHTSVITLFTQPTVADQNKAPDMLIWFHIIMAFLGAILIVVVLIVVVICLAIYFYQRSISLRHPPTSLDHVVLRRRTRQPSDPLPPIRDSLILHSSTVTTKDSSFPTTTIHCSPLQNQLLMVRSLQDVSFNLNSPKSTDFALYTEVGSRLIDENPNLFYDSENTSSSAMTIYCDQTSVNVVTESSIHNLDDTCSSHDYTLPDDAKIYTQKSLSSSSSWSEEQWSPLLIKERNKGRSAPSLQLVSATYTCSLSSESVDIDIPLDDTDTHSDNCYDNLIVFQQSPQNPISGNSLTRQPFSFGANPDDHNSLLPQSCAPHTPLSTKSETCTSESIPFSFLLHNSKPNTLQTVDLVSSHDLCSSSTSSGCTDLSKYSGNYERDPDYMKALADKMLQSPNSERTGVDSGLDGIYSPLSSFMKQTEEQLSWQYKSLDNLTMNPPPIYAKPVWEEDKKDKSMDSFVTITV